MDLALKAKRAKVLAGILSGARPLTGPRFVLFRINHTCNMKCEMCASFSELVPAQYRIDSRSDMDFDLYIRLIDECAKLDVERVSVGGEGEPSLHPRFMDMLQAAKDRNLEGTTITNGARMTPENAARMVEMGWDELNVSMNAGDRETHEKVTKTKTWERVHQGLSRVAELKRSRGSTKPQVRLSNTIFHTNYHSIVDMVRFAIEVEADEMTVGLATLDDFPDDGRHILAMPEPELRRAADLLAEARVLADRAPRLRHNIGTFQASIGNHKAQKGITESVQLSIPCTVGYWLVVIDPDGSVHPCCQCEGALGRVEGSTTLETLWYGPSYRRFRQEARELPERGRSLEGCTCHSCAFTPDNVMYYNKLHPMSRVDGTRVSPNR